MDLFSFFFVVATFFENHIPNRELVQQQGYFYCKLLVQYTTVHIAKKLFASLQDHLYGLWTEIQTCRHNCILF